MSELISHQLYMVGQHPVEIRSLWSAFSASANYIQVKSLNSFLGNYTWWDHQTWYIDASGMIGHDPGEIRSLWPTFSASANYIQA